MVGTNATFAWPALQAMMDRRKAGTVRKTRNLSGIWSKCLVNGGCRHEISRLGSPEARV
jgi:hypothetical protein